MKPLTSEEYLRLAQDAQDNNFATAFQKQTMMAAWHQCALMIELIELLRRPSTPTIPQLPESHFMRGKKAKAAK